MPRGQTRGVQSEPRLTRERAAKRFTARENRGSLSSQTQGFAEFFEVLRVKFVSFHIRLDVSSRQARLLKRELRGAGERRRRIRKESNVAKRKNIEVL